MVVPVLMINCQVSMFENKNPEAAHTTIIMTQAEKNPAREAILAVPVASRSNHPTSGSTCDGIVM